MQLFLNTFDQSSKLVPALSELIVQSLSDGLESSHQASLVVSGGTTPIPLFKALSESTLSWDRVLITLADERLASTESGQRNDQLVYRHLLKGQAENARFLPMLTSELVSDQDPQIQQTAIPQLESELSSIDAYDVVVLGMGEDGHTASIFPKASNLSELLFGQKRSVYTVDPVTVGPMRITQSLHRLMTAKSIIIHITGQGKWATFQEAVDQAQSQVSDSGDGYPIAHLLRQATCPVHIFHAKGQT